MRAGSVLCVLAVSSVQCKEVKVPGVWLIDPWSWSVAQLPQDSTAAAAQ